LKYADGSESKPTVSTPPTKDETEKLAKWEEEDARAQTQIELTLSDPQMIHIVGAKSAAEMWTQLRTARGKMGIISARRRLYRKVAEDSTDISVHITELRNIQEELHLLGSRMTNLQPS